MQYRTWNSRFADTTLSGRQALANFVVDVQNDMVGQVS